MGQKEKLIQRLKSKPKDFTFDEAETLLRYLSYVLNILRWRSHPISWNRAMESVIESHSSDGGSHDPCRGSQ